MSDDWMPTIRLSLTLEQFWQLPRNPAYRYEYVAGKALLSPRPKHYHALLDLNTPSVVESDVECCGARLADINQLVPLFAACFQQIQPFGSLDEENRKEASRQALERTRQGGDGPFIEQASFVARQQDHLAGAILITLLPGGDPCDWDAYRWLEPPPPDCIEHRLGQPHLTWIFVSPLRRGHGVGTALLGKAVQALVGLGYKKLLSTFMNGNDSSMLWHWRNGFRLLPHPASMRRLREQATSYQARARPGGNRKKNQQM
jgi:GNAT superfamily N-acetyltransferase